MPARKYQKGIMPAQKISKNGKACQNNQKRAMPSKKNQKKSKTCQKIYERYEAVTDIRKGPAQKINNKGQFKKHRRKTE